jgi:hypothetical protein
MRPVLYALGLIALATPVFAQEDVPPPPTTAVTVSPAEGNWGCIALVDDTKAGLLTIFNGSYGYASANFGSAASGTGEAQMGSDGVRFLNGNLTNVGIITGIVALGDDGLDVLTLSNPEKPILSCKPR